MPDENPSLLRRMWRVAAELIVALYVIADTAANLVFRPLVRMLSGWRIIQRLERGIDALPPYVILVLMGVPFLIAEFAKVFALFWMSEGHLRTGMTIFIGAYIVSIFVCERILHAGKRKLMTIRWFAICYNWVMVIRDHVFGWFRRTRIWAVATDLRSRTQGLIERGLTRLRILFGRKPKRLLERR